MHAITADVGDVSARLAVEGVTVDFPIYSDPDGELIVPDACIFGEVDESRSYYIPVQKHEYMPALFVTDEQGHVTTWWSWKQLSTDVLDRVSRLDIDPTCEGEWDAGLVEVDVGSFGMTPRPESAQNGAKKTWLVNVRPAPADLVGAILEGRKTLQLEEMLSTDETMAAHQRSIEGLPVKPPCEWRRCICTMLECHPETRRATALTGCVCLGADHKP